ncbi:GGDEF domain-containing protein [Nitrincola sp. A-D6]|uniref:GGDEF domain-containing protein n=1 Tax=Nitrincola sp. A-D6 TaxID=1545442 RepID=UPI00068EDFDD|nr:GGDEF domain-containing protein [Nitrincola sp. A-D6]
MQNEMLRKAQTELEVTRDRYADLFDFAPIPYITLSADGKISEANLAATALLAGDQKDLVGHGFAEFLVPDDLARWVRHVNAGWQLPGMHLPEFELLLRGNGRALFSAELHCMVTARPGAFSSMRIALFDITERLAIAARMEQLAYFDSLTQLPNRRLFHDRLEQAVTASKRSNRYGALLYLDLDGFKLLNDTHGHDAGDHMLIEVAHRLRTSLREGDTVARIGGDEFVMILERLAMSEAGAAQFAQEVGEKLKRAIALSFDPEGVELQCSVSIGIRMFGPTSHVDDLLKQADQALYQAKRAGRNQISFFNAKT